MSFLISECGCHSGTLNGMSSCPSWYLSVAALVGLWTGCLHVLPDIWVWLLQWDFELDVFVSLLISECGCHSGTLNGMSSCPSWYLSVAVAVGHWTGCLRVLPDIWVWLLQWDFELDVFMSLLISECGCFSGTLNWMSSCPSWYLSVAVAVGLWTGCIHVLPDIWVWLLQWDFELDVFMSLLISECGCFSGTLNWMSSCPSWYLSVAVAVGLWTGCLHVPPDIWVWLLQWDFELDVFMSLLISECGCFSGTLNWMSSCPSWYLSVAVAVGLLTRCLHVPPDIWVWLLQWDFELDVFMSFLISECGCCSGTLNWMSSCPSWYLNVAALVGLWTGCLHVPPDIWVWLLQWDFELDVFMSFLISECGCCSGTLNWMSSCPSWYLSVAVAVGLWTGCLHVPPDIWVWLLQWDFELDVFMSSWYLSVAVAVGLWTGCLHVPPDIWVWLLQWDFELDVFMSLLISECGCCSGTLNWMSSCPSWYLSVAVAVGLWTGCLPETSDSLSGGTQERVCSSSHVSWQDRHRWIRHRSVAETHDQVRSGAVRLKSLDYRHTIANVEYHKQRNYGM